MKKRMTGVEGLAVHLMTFCTDLTRPAKILAGLLGIVGLTTTTGCTADSWFDPSVVGRWETTPAVAPIIDRLDVVEPAEKDFVDTSEVTPGDLIPDIQAYTVGPSDALLIEIFELFQPRTPYIFQRIVDDTGYISVPLIGPVYVAGLSETEIQRAIADRLSPDVLRDPQVSVIAQDKMQNRFSVSGPSGAGLIDIPHPRFRLTDALAAYGSTPIGTDYLYVIRQVPLDESMIRGTSRLRPPNENNEEKSGDTDESNAEPAKEGIGVRDAPAEDPDLLKLIDELAASGDEGDVEQPSQPVETKMHQTNQEGEQPALQMPAPGEESEIEQPTKWVYLNGQWVRVAIDPSIAGSDEEPTDLITEQDISNLVTQRVIRVPTKPLLEGVAAYNIIIRPNDIIRIPSPEIGIIYMTGEIARPGSFDLPPTGRQTLIRAIAAAGGLAPLAIPERVDIIRMLPNNRQATVRVNLRAIMEMTEPDIYLKPGDVINIGTTWYAAPLAVVRNGFRMSYGFGFLLDRNFGNDVFGAAPSNDRLQ